MFVNFAILALPTLVVAGACPAPAPPEPSSAPPAPQCGSLHPLWKLDPINLSSYYTYTSPSASGPKLGSISFTFANDQVDYTAQCSGSSVNPQGTFYASQLFTCVTPGGAAWKNTTFSYDTSSSVIAVNSTWRCCDTCDVVYSTSGSVKVDLDCKTEIWTNPDWQAGELYSNTTTVCQPGSVSIQL